MLQTKEMEIVWNEAAALHFAKWLSVNSWQYHSGYSRWSNAEDMINMFTNEQVMEFYKADEWSKEFLGAKALLIKTWHKSGEYAYAQASSFNYDQDRLIIKAHTEADALKFFKDNNGFGKTGDCPPYVVRKDWKDGILTCLATYCGYD